MKSGARPEAPPGGHTTQFVPLPDPARDPEEERLPPVVAAPPEEVALEPRVPPPPPPAPETAPVAPLVEVEVELEVEVDVALLEAVVVPVVLPAVGVLPVVVDELETAGSDTAPPVVGKPLRVEALLTAPFVEVAVCAAAGTAMPTSRAMTRIGARVISRQRKAL